MALEKLAPDTFAFPEVASPGTPPSGHVYVYAKSDGNMYQKDDAGTETSLVAGAGSFTSFNAAGDSGTPQAITDGNTLTIAGGTALSSVASATDTVTLNLDNTAVTPGSYTNTDLTVDAQGRITAAASGTVALGSEVSGTLPIANGGTNGTTQTAAMDNLSPTTTKGDLLVDNGTNVVRLPVGTDYYHMRARAGATNGLEWSLLFTQHLVGSYLVPSNISTTSSSYADIDGTNIKQSVTITTGETVVARFFLSNITQITGGTGSYKLVAGTTDPDSVMTITHTLLQGTGALLIAKWTGLTTGTYDIKPQFKTSANTARVVAGSSIEWEVMVY